MAFAIARVGDPIDHGGQVTQGSPTVFVNGKAAARVGDQVMCSRHGMQTITEGSATVFFDGRKAARVTSRCSCGATITAGSTRG